MSSKKIITVIKSLFKFCIVPMILLLTIFFIYNTINIEFCEDRLNEITYEQSLKYSIFNPNIEVGRTETTMLGGFKYTHKTLTYRNIRGNISLEDEHNVIDGLLPIYNSKTNQGQLSDKVSGVSNLSYDKRLHSLGGERQLVFIKPNNEKEVINDDRKLLEEFKDNDIIEVAISFDKSYNIDFIKDYLMRDITTFIWINDESSFISRFEDNIFLGSEIFGIKLISEYDDLIIDKFIDSLISLKGLKYQSLNYDRIYEFLVGEDEKLTKNDLLVNGVTLVGNKNQILNYINNDFVKYVFVGSSTE